MSTPALNPLVSKIRAAYPGAYDDLDDAALTKSVLAKYPQYSDLAAPTGPKGQLGDIRPPQPAMNPMAGTQSLIAPAHGAGSLGPGQPEAQPGMGSAGATGLALGAGAATAPAAVSAALPFIKSFAAKHPFLVQTAASEAISQARKLPGVGKFIPPYSEWLPFLIGGGKGKPEAAEPAGASTDQLPGRPYQPNPRYEPPSEPEPLPARTGPLLLKGQTATPEQLNPSLTSPSRSLPGQISAERIYGPRPEPAQGIPPRQGLMLPGEVSTPQLPFLRKAPPEPLADSAAYNTGPGPSVQWGPKPGSPEDLAESRAIEDQVRSAADQEQNTFESQQRKEWFRRNDPSTAKSDLTGQPAAPVKYGKPRAKTNQGSPSPSTGDLTPVLQNMLDRVLAIKAQRK